MNWHIHWHISIGVGNPVEVLDEHNLVVLRVYDWTRPDENSGLSIREHRTQQAINKAQMIIDALKSGPRHEQGA